MKFTRRTFLKAGGTGLVTAVVAERAYDHLSESTTKAKIVIVGGGTAGISMAAQLTDKLRYPDITIIEPSEKHFYQPGFTLIAAGVFTPDSVVRQTNDFVPSGVHWVQDSVAELSPETNEVVTAKNGRIAYDFLVLAAGCQMNFNLIDGISREKLGEGNAHSVYDYAGASKYRDAMAKLPAGSGKNLVFANTYTKLKCGGAPKKVCLFTEDYLRKHGARDKYNVTFFAAANELMKPPTYGDRLLEIFKQRKIDVQLNHRLIAVDTAARKATFQAVDKPTPAAVPRDDAKTVIIDYDLLHFAPPMSAPDFVQQSALAAKDPGGWAATDKSTLVHTKFKNIIALGDVAGLPTSKTGAAIRVQTPIAVANLVLLMENKEPAQHYNGYSACPIITEYGKVMMCEFGYDDKLMPTLSWLDPAEPRAMWWTVKVDVLKPMYFDGMLRGYV